MSVSDEDVRAANIALLLSIIIVKEILEELNLWLINNSNHPHYYIYINKKTTLMEKLLKLDAKRNAVKDAGNNISIPEKQTVQKIQTLSNEVQQLTDTAKSAEKILQLINSTLGMANDVLQVNATSSQQS